jgi:large subunit ribosomal protein L3
VLGAIYGKKLGMTSIFDEEGNVISVTVVEAGPVTVTQIKTNETDGYCALQLGFGDKKLQRATKPEIGHAKKAGAAPKRLLREIKVSEEALSEYSAGQEITLEGCGLESGDFIDVVGTSIGKGFAGVIKRHNFHGSKNSHGVHEGHRGGGSIGCAATPARVIKGRKMAGQMGNERVTVQNLVIHEIRPEENLILIKGAIPGSKGRVVLVKAAKKKIKEAGEAA